MWGRQRRHEPVALLYVPGVHAGHADAPARSSNAQCSASVVVILQESRTSLAYIIIGEQRNCARSEVENRFQNSVENKIWIALWAMDPHYHTLNIIMMPCTSWLLLFSWHNRQAGTLVVWASTAWLPQGGEGWVQWSLYLNSHTWNRCNDSSGEVFPWRKQNESDNTNLSSCCMSLEGTLSMRMPLPRASTLYTLIT